MQENPWCPCAVKCGPYDAPEQKCDGCLAVDVYVRNVVELERARFAAFIENEQSFLTAGDKKMLIEKIREGY